MPTFMLDQLGICDSQDITIHKLQTLFNVEYDFAAKRLEPYLNRKRDMLNRHTHNESKLLYVQ